MGDRAPENDVEVAEFRERLNKAPNARAFLVSQDQTAALVTATFIERRLDYAEVFEYVQTLAASNRDAGHDIYVAGQPILTGWVYSHQVEMLSIFAVTTAALVLSLVLYMSNLAGVVTPLLTSIVAAIWGFGFVGWLAKPIEPLIMVVPLLLVARSFSHCVQFVERYYEIYQQCANKREATESALRVMMAPGILGILTDAAGLFLIMVAPIPAMERFALFCGFWALILFPTNVLLSPIILSWLPEPRNVQRILGADEQGGGSHRIIYRLLGAIGRLSHGSSARFTVSADCGGHFQCYKSCKSKWATRWKALICFGKSRTTTRRCRR